MKFVSSVCIGCIITFFSWIYSQSDPLVERLMELQQKVVELKEQLRQMVPGSDQEPLKPESLEILQKKPIPGKKPFPSGMPLSAEKSAGPSTPEVGKLPLPTELPIEAVKPHGVGTMPDGVVVPSPVQVPPAPPLPSAEKPTRPVTEVVLPPPSVGLPKKPVEVPAAPPSLSSAVSAVAPQGEGRVALPVLPSEVGVAKSKPSLAPEIPEALPVPSEGVPPPPLPGIGLPPPPPPVLGASSGLFGPKKVLQPLTEQELTAIALPEQALSDQLVLKALYDAANPNLKTFKAYRDIWNSLSYQEGFKKRQELQLLLKAIDQMLKKKSGASDADFLAPLVQLDQKVLEQINSLIKDMFFNKQHDIEFLTERFVINIIAIQRAAVNKASLKESQKIISDELASATLQQALKLGQQSTVNAVYEIFDRLRLQPPFLRYAVMVAVGKEKPKGADAKSLQEELKAKVGIAEEGAVITQPLLSILHDVAIPLPIQVEQALKTLFFFPGIEFADQSFVPMVRAIIEDKRKQLAAKGTAKVTLDQLADTLMEAKDIARLKFILRSYPAIYDLFASPQLSADSIIDGLAKEFTTSVSNQLKRHIHSIIDPFIEQQHIARIVAQELAAAIKRYNQTKEYQDASFYKDIAEQLQKERSVKKVKELLDYFISLYRVEFEVWEKLKSLIGSELLKEYDITDQKVFFLFAPYGMILQLLSDFVKNGDYDVLITSLRGLNGDHASSKGLIRPEEPNYASVIKEHKQRLTNYGIYKNMLMPIIKAFMNFDMVDGLTQVTRLVERAQLDITKKPEYKQLLEAVRAKALTLRVNSLLDQLKGLNQDSPTASIAGLPRPGAGVTVSRDILLRNALMYEELAGKLTEFIKVIHDSANNLAAIDAATLVDKVPWKIIEEHLQAQKDYQKGLQIVRDYIQAIVTQIQDLQKIAQAELIH